MRRPLSPYGDARPPERRPRMTGFGRVALLGVVLLAVGLLGTTVQLSTDDALLPLVAFGAMLLLPVGGVLIAVALLGWVVGGRRYR